QPTSQAAVWRALVELGVVGAAFDESHGGFAGDARTLAVIMAQLGAALALQPFLDTAVIAGRILQHWTDGAARQAALRAIMGGRLIMVCANLPIGTADMPARVTASQRHDATVLTGDVTCVRHGQLAEDFLIPAVADDGISRIYQVPRESPGLVLETY